MKKIFTLIAMAALAMSANAQGVVWAMASAPNEPGVISDDAIASTTITVTGQDATYQDGQGFRIQKPSAGDNNGIFFVTFQPADADEGVTVEWTANVAAGKSATLKNVSLNMARFGTDGGTVTLSYQIDGADAEVLDESLIPARNNKSKEDDAKGEEEKYTAAYSKRVRNVPAASSSIKLIAKFTGLATNKQIGYAQVSLQTGAENPIANISSVSTNAQANGVAYNLAGQKVADDFKGLVIVNGKKLIRK